MGLSKDEINLIRLLETAPQQTNQAKLIHYVTHSRKLRDQLAQEKTPEGLPRISKAKLSEYSEKIEALAAKLAVPEPTIQEAPEPSVETSVNESPKKAAGESIQSSEGLRRRLVPPSSNEDRPRDRVEDDQSMPIKLDASAKAHIDKHRKLQDDLTDEMVELARQLKESSLMMNQSIQNTEKILDSTEKAVEHSLASTGHATNRAVDVYSKSSKTSCLTWLAFFLMTCIFIMVVLLIRIT